MESENLLPARVETAAVSAPRRKAQPAPGADLTTRQRKLAECIVSEGVSPTKAARICGIPERTGQAWATKPEVRRYVGHLVDQALSMAQATVKGRFARLAPQVAERVGELALGKGRRGRPQHAYMDRFCSLVLGQVSPAPKPAASELGIRVPTEHGDVVIVWRSSARHPTDCTCGNAPDCQRSEADRAQDE